MESVERFEAMAEDVSLISKVLDKRISQIMDYQLLQDLPPIVGHPSGPLQQTALGSPGSLPATNRSSGCSVASSSAPVTVKLTASEFFEKLSQSGDEFFVDIRRVVADLPPIMLQVSK